MTKKNNSVFVNPDLPKEIQELPNNTLMILADLYKANRPLSIKNIAERNRITWKTAKDNLEKLKERKLVECNKSIRRSYYSLTKNFRESIRIIKG